MSPYLGGQAAQPFLSKGVTNRRMEKRSGLPHPPGKDVSFTGVQGKKTTLFSVEPKVKAEVTPSAFRPRPVTRHLTNRLKPIVMVPLVKSLHLLHEPPADKKTVKLPELASRSPSIWAKRLKKQMAQALEQPKKCCMVCIISKRSISLLCGHHVCKPCLKAQMEVEFKYLRRPECVACKELVPWKLLKECAREAPELYQHYSDYIASTLSPVDTKDNAEVVSQWQKSVSDEKRMDTEDLKAMSDKIRLGKIRVCNHCHVLIERVEGCKYMVCTNCRHAFCWVCNDSWRAGRHNVCDLATMITPRTFRLPTLLSGRKK